MERTNGEKPTTTTAAGGAAAATSIGGDWWTRGRVRRGVAFRRTDGVRVRGKVRVRVRVNG